MSFEQWIGNRHGYCDAHEEGERGDEGGGGGSDHVDVGIVVSVGLEMFTGYTGLVDVGVRVLGL